MSASYSPSNLEGVASSRTGTMTRVGLKTPTLAERVVSTTHPRPLLPATATPSIRLRLWRGSWSLSGSKRDCPPPVYNSAAADSSAHTTTFAASRR